MMVPITNKCLVNGSNGLCLGSKDKAMVPISFKAVRKSFHGKRRLGTEFSRMIRI